MRRQSEIRVTDTIIDASDPAPKRAWVRNPGRKRPLYKVFISLEGPDLPYVDHVTYVLHPTFKNRYQTVHRTISNPNCQLSIWTWGLFEVAVQVQFKDGSSSTLKHQLSYDRELNSGELDIREASV